MLLTIKSEIPKWVEKQVDVADDMTIDRFKEEVSQLISLPKQFIKLSVHGVVLDKGELKDYKDKLTSGDVYFSYVAGVFA